MTQQHEGSEIGYNGEVDRGPTDPTDVIAVVIKHKNDLNRLGSEHGIIKGWHGSENIQSATSEFTNIDQVKTKEMTIREIVSSLTGGHGFFLAVTLKGNVQQKKMCLF
ncbi:Hypothetical protein CINCED_3A021859 [Cinara cedri]|uniref:Uncharacterized protein n=1 Tax=Cinara cedri TaxID=506608 RepID=A0A5E4MGV6_9HEMI|nr:Hypothetical protein CINCED_3A021859 [Cinara cedri]